MVPSVAPVTGKVGVQKLVFLGVDGVADLSCVAHGDLLIPAFLSGGMLALERVETADVDVEVRQCHRNC